MGGGESAPTFLQLETLAVSVYRRPVALFSFRAARRAPTRHEFRTLPTAEIDSLPPTVRYELRRAKSLQLSLRELTGNTNPSPRLIWRDLGIDVDEPVKAAANRIRAYLGITLQTQRSWRDSREAMRAWRQAVEAVGVFVFKQPFKTDEVSGFCLYDREFPIIMVNNGSTFTRQIFTVFHESAHILFGLSGLTPDDLAYAERIEGTVNRRVEMACNELAAEVLVPGESFPLERLAGSDDLVSAVELVAYDYSVSREVILRRLLDAGVVDQRTYLRWATEWSNQRTYEGGTGGSYYNNQRAYLGEAFLRLAFSHYDAGLISLGDLAEHLGMKAQTAVKFESAPAGRS